MENNVENKQSSRNDGNTMLAEGLLISMTEFVSRIGNMKSYPSHNKALSWIYNYATFLKQPLKLEMFVPCDEDEKVFEEPKNPKHDWELTSFDIAKEKVLFENVEIYRNWKYNLYFLSKIEFAKYDFKTNQFIVNHPFDNVESIISLKPKLTKSALSAIFG